MGSKLKLILGYTLFFVIITFINYLLLKSNIDIHAGYIVMTVLMLHVAYKVYTTKSNYFIIAGMLSLIILSGIETFYNSFVWITQLQKIIMVALVLFFITMYFIDLYRNFKQNKANVVKLEDDINGRSK